MPLLLGVAFCLGLVLDFAMLLKALTPLLVLAEQVVETVYLFAQRLLAMILLTPASVLMLVVLLSSQEQVHCLLLLQLVIAALLLCWLVWLEQNYM